MELDALLPFDLSVEKLALSLVVRPAIELSYRTAVAHWSLGDQMPTVSRCYNKVRGELEEVGLLYDPVDENDDGYLEQIELNVALLPSMGEAGYVFERLPWIGAIVGFREGVIYLPADLPRNAYVPGGTLTDVIRHEYAHCWHWLEPEFFETGWFAKTFGGRYEEDGYSPLDLWSNDRTMDRAFVAQTKACRNERELSALLRRSFSNDFVSEYAATHFCEDFAETFMTFLRYRKCLDKFKGRTGVFRKLKAVEKAVAKARLELAV